MIEMRITYDEATGNVNVNGPINNKGICYLMLECARDAIKDCVDRAQAIVPEPNGLPTFARKQIRHRR